MEENPERSADHSNSNTEGGHLAFSRSLPFKLGRNTILIALTIGLILSVFQVVVDFKNERRSIDAGIRQLMATLEKSAEEAAYQLDKRQGLHVLDGLFVLPSVFQAEIVDDFGDTLVQKAKQNWPGPPGMIARLLLGEKQLREVSLYSEEGQRPVGMLRLWLDLDLLAENFRSRVWLIVVSGLLRNLFLAAILAFMFHMLIARPLMAAVIEIQSKKKNGRKGATVTVPKPHSDDELGALLTSFNALVSDLDAAAVEQHDSDERFRVTMMNSPVTVVNQDRDLRYTWIFNPVPGITVEDVLGKRDEDLLGPEDAAALTRFKQGVLDSGIGGRQVFTLDLPQGRTIMDMTCEPLRDAKGEIIGLAIAGADITEQESVKLALSETEAQYRSVFDNSAVGMVLTGSNGRYLRVNHAATDIIGYSSEELLSMSVSDVSHPGDLPISSDIVRRLWAGESDGISFEKRYVHKDGKTVWGAVTISPVLGADGNVEFLSGQIQDITERKRTEKRLNEFEERREAWLEHSPVCTKIVDLDLNLQYMSSAGVQGLGIEDISQFYGKPYPFEFYPESFKKRMTTNLNRTKETGEIITQEAPVVDLEGNELWFHSTLVPIFDDDNRIDYILVVSADITERKLMERELLQSQKMAAVGQLAAGVAHEINNPLGFVTSNLHALKDYLDELLSLAGAQEGEEADGDAPPLPTPTLKGSSELPHIISDTPALLRDCEDGLARIGHIVTGLKGFSRASDAEWEAADLRECIEGTLTVVRNELKYHCEVITEFGDIPKVKCIPAEINQVILNLLVNAGQAIEDKGNITIRTGTAGGEAWIEVADTGKGIPEEDRERIFEPFFTTKPTGKGTGLGLSVSYGIIQNHNGRFEVQSEPDEGTTFRVWLPLRREQGQTAADS